MGHNTINTSLSCLPFVQVLCASFRRYYPDQVIRVSRSATANGPLSQHPLPQQVLFTLVKYYVEPQLSMNKSAPKLKNAAAITNSGNCSGIFLLICRFSSLHL